MQRTRSHLLLDLRKTILETMNNFAMQAKLQAMADLAVTNSRLLGLFTEPATFLFDGVWYTNPVGCELPRSKKHLNRQLDFSLVTQATKIIKTKTYEEQEAFNHLTNYVGDVLKSSRTWRDVRNLLPLEILVSIPMEQIAFDTGEPLSQEEMDTINNRNSKGHAAVKYFLMEELLMAKANV